MKDRKEIKALECCGNQMYSCTDKQCKAKTIGDAIDLIKRLQADNEELFCKLAGVMLFVDKWLDGKELEQDEIQRAATMREKTLQIVERQQAEIEDLKESKGFPFFTNDTQVVTVNRKADGQYYADVVTQIQVDKIRAEAIKEFAERLKEKKFYCQNPHSPVSTYAIEVAAIDNLVKEMTEVKDDD